MLKARQKKSHQKICSSQMFFHKTVPSDGVVQSCMSRGQKILPNTLRFHRQGGLVELSLSCLAPISESLWNHLLFSNRLGLVGGEFHKCWDRNFPVGVWESSYSKITFDRVLRQAYLAKFSWANGMSETLMICIISKSWRGVFHRVKSYASKSVTTTSCELCSLSTVKTELL